MSTRTHPNSIVQLRGKCDWSLQDLEKHSRIDEWTLRHLETGKVTLHAGHIQRLSTVFGCTAEELLKPCRARRNPQLSRRRSLQNLELGRGPRRWAGNLTVPEKGHPLVRDLYQLMNANKILIKDLVQPSGVKATTISEWRYRRTPNVASLEAVLNALGFKLDIVPDE